MKVTIIIGASGTGKTSLLKSVVGNNDFADINGLICSRDKYAIHNYIGDKRFVLFEEANYLKNYNLNDLFEVMKDSKDQKFIFVQTKRDDLTDRLFERFKGECRLINVEIR